MNNFHIKIDKEERSHVTREAKRGERWDADDIYYDHTINGFSIVKEKEYWDFILTTNPKDKMLFLVYALYDTGDSFHRAENRISLVWLGEHIEDAKAIIDYIDLDYETYDDSKFDHKPLEILLPKSSRIEKISSSDWKGYFEKLRSVEIKPIQESYSIRINRCYKKI